MKHHLTTLKPEHKQRYLEAIFRLHRNSSDFATLVEFMRYCLEVSKNDLIVASVDNFPKLQGEATVLSGFFDLLELAEKEGSK
ncbi:hypothetical protein BTZ53_10915 [Vibrio parahaemolyticus]|uniref:hypothetical protein n=1 Tax=Vibrio parahaemolyticus TaxID=670 RepID=UPI000A39BDAA|nr:hypothetical protein [Vibrio parahaemolyticus]OUJ46319.1 hypothetical protein BTZ53_10915 [Vibrio parahaemolyticus]HCG6030292.1 hypothetical protein [Vibrio parahaemolyticus]